MFVFLTAGALLLTKDGVTTSFLLNLLFYIITPVISLTMTRIMFQSENAMIVADALRRIDSVLALQPLTEPQQLAYPKDSSVEVEDVTFSYDGQKDALQHISLSIQPGQTVAFVGPSASGTPAAGASRWAAWTYPPPTPKRCWSCMPSYSRT